MTPPSFGIELCHTGVRHRCQRVKHKNKKMWKTIHLETQTSLFIIFSIQEYHENRFNKTIIKLSTCIHIRAMPHLMCNVRWSVWSKIRWGWREHGRMGHQISLVVHQKASHADGLLTWYIENNFFLYTNALFWFSKCNLYSIQWGTVLSLHNIFLVFLEITIISVL